MKNIKLHLAALLLGFGLTVSAQDKGKTITQNVAASGEHKFLSANLATSGLSQTLSGKGPFTLFAATDQAFEKSPSINVEKSVKAVDKADLQGLITYHIVAGKMDSKAIAAAIKAGGGKTTLTTLEGGKLIATLDGSRLLLSDEKGNKITVTTPDGYASNGVIHVTDKVFTRK